MNSEIEVLPVTPEEAVRILGLPRIDELEELLDEIRILRKNTLLEKTIMLVRERQSSETSLIVSN